MTSYSAWPPARTLRLAAILTLLAQLFACADDSSSASSSEPIEDGTYFVRDGAPEWAIEDDGLPFDQNPVWSLNYFAPAVMAAFDNFFEYPGEHSYLQDQFADA
jgi:hypothetical protein